MNGPDNHPLLGDARQSPSSLCCLITLREAQVTRAICYGWPNKRIAVELNISIKTVEKHHQNINTKVGGGGIAGVIHWALKNDVLDVKSWLSLPKLPA